MFLQLPAGQPDDGELRDAVVQRDVLLARLQRQQAIVDSAVGVGIIATDREGLITDWNRGASHILWWSQDEMRGQSLDLIFASRDGAAHHARSIMATALEDGRFVGEMWLRRSDGSRLWTSCDLTPLRDDRGEHVGFVQIVRDRTTAREAVQALANAEGALERAQAAGGVGIFSVDVTTDITEATEACCRLFGLPVRDRFPTADIERLVIPEDADAISTRETRAAGMIFREVEYRIRRANDGAERWMSRRGEIEFDEAGRPLRLVGVIRDITDQRLARDNLARSEEKYRSLSETLERRISDRTAELMRTEEALRQSQKMEAVGQLTGGLAHDFNNLLTAISGSLEMIGVRIRQGHLAGLERYLEGAEGAASRAAALTHRLLAFSRRQPLDPKPTDMNILVNDMEELVRRTMGPAVALELMLEGQLWTTLVDPNQLENALLNLCINARDAMPTGGKLVIATANRSFDDGAAAQRGMTAGDYVRLTVTDTGTGMSPEIARRAFDPFFTTKPIGQGTGLGLSMIYGFVRQSGGQVRMQSKADRGTTIRLLLPRHAGALISTESKQSSLNAFTSRHGETALVVDDEPTVRMLVTEVLTDLGYTPIEAGDSASGLEMLRSDAKIDLLVTDIGLPGGLNGRQMADAARVLRPELKVLFITGYAEAAVIGDGHMERGMHLLTKPFDLTTLAARIHALISPN